MFLLEQRGGKEKVCANGIKKKADKMGGIKAQK
jgi:hypothetical protein